MTKNIICKCGKVLGVKCLENQEITLSSKASILSAKHGDVKILCPNCTEFITEVGKVKK